MKEHGYQEKMLEFGKVEFEDKKVFYLPHSCDEWVIGDIENAILLHKELGELINNYYKEEKK